jgi:putative permease
MTVGERFRAWFERHFSDPQVLLLVTVLGVGLAAIVLLGQVLAPVIAGAVIAYVLDSPVRALTAKGVPRVVAVAVVFTGFLALSLLSVLTVLPMLSQQLAQLVKSLPAMVMAIQEVALDLPERYPEFIQREQVTELAGSVQRQLLGWGQGLLRFSVAGIGNLLTVIVYLFLVPLMVFFFLKDKDRILAWIVGFLPEERGLVTRVWNEVDHKTGAYVRGKIYELGIIGTASWFAFTLLDLEFGMLLAVLTGFSVFIPYIGVAAVAVPVVIVSLFQFGLSGEMAAVVGVYGAIQVVDGNLLAPLLISEVVDIHPIVVIAAVLVFGGIWGFWGLFFAIPLATLAEAVLNTWPRSEASGDKRGRS